MVMFEVWSTCHQIVGPRDQSECAGHVRASVLGIWEILEQLSSAAALAVIYYPVRVCAAGLSVWFCPYVYMCIYICMYIIIIV